MKVEFTPKPLCGVFSAPPSKSIIHRLLLGATLAKGESKIYRAALSDDISATLDCIRAFGVDWALDGDCLSVHGVGSYPLVPRRPLFCRECGTTMRFLIPYCLTLGENIIMTGSGRLLERPLDVYEDICAAQGLTFSRGENELCLCGKLTPGAYIVPGNQSSQFASGLLFILPTLDGDSTLKLEQPFESRPYFDLTLEILKLFGIRVQHTDDPDLFIIPGNQEYRSGTFSVGGDLSNTAYFDALRQFPENRIRVKGVSPFDSAEHRRFLDALDQMTEGTPTLAVEHCPDLVPVLMAFAAAHHGAHFTGTRRLAYKESDRANAMAEELAAFGTAVTVSDNEVHVDAVDFHAPDRMLSGHNDHRIVMALSTLLSRTGGIIDGGEAVTKSFPEFFMMMIGIGAKIAFENSEND